MQSETDGRNRGAFFNENFRRRSRYQLVFLALVAALLVITVLNINTGSVAIPVGEIFRILLGQAQDSPQYSIIWKIRLPRILMAALLGGAAVTAVEALCGVVFNRRHQVWDYRRESLNWRGHICLRFSLLWCGLAGLWMCLDKPRRLS